MTVHARKMFGSLNKGSKGHVNLGSEAEKSGAL